MSRTSRAWPRTAGIATALTALTLGIYLLTGRYVGSGDTVPAEVLPIAYLYAENFAFDPFVPADSPLPPYFQRVRGRVVSTYPIMPGILNLPAFVVAAHLGWDLLERRQELSLITASTVAAASAGFLCVCLLRLCRSTHTAIAMTLLYAFGTDVWSVASRGMWQHGPGLLFLNAGLALLSMPSAAGLAPAGLAFGFAIFTRPATFVQILPLLAFAWRRHRGWFVGCAALLSVPLLLMTWYSRDYFGTMWAFGQGQSLERFNGDVVPNLIGLMFSPARGLLVFTPVLGFGVVFLVREVIRRVRGRDLHRATPAETLSPYLALSVVAGLLLNARWGVWWGGHAFGYRLLLETVPALVIGTALAWEQLGAHRTGLRVVFLATTMISVVVQVLGIVEYPCGFDVAIDADPARLWDVADTELTRCAANLFDRFSSFRSRST